MVKAPKVDKVKVKKNLLQKPKPKQKQKQKQKQSQSVVVNVNKPATRTRKPAQPKKIELKSLDSKPFFQPPIYLPPVAAIKPESKLVPPQPEVKIENALEKKKPVEPEVVKPSLFNLFNPFKAQEKKPESLVGGIAQTIKPELPMPKLERSPDVKPVPQLTKLYFLPSDKPDSIISGISGGVPTIAEPKTSFLQPVKYEPPKKQPWAELEVGESKQEIMQKESKPGYNNPPLTKPFVFEPIIPAEPVEQEFFDIEEEPAEEVPPEVPEAPLEAVGEPQETGILKEEQVKKPPLTNYNEQLIERLRKQVKKPVEQLKLTPTISGEDVPSFYEKLQLSREKPPPPKILAIEPDYETSMFKPKDDSSYSFASEQTDAGIKKNILEGWKKPLAIEAIEAPMGEEKAGAGLLSAEQEVTPDIDPDLPKIKILTTKQLRGLLWELGKPISYSGKGGYLPLQELNNEARKARGEQPQKFKELLDDIQLSKVQRDKLK